MFTCGQSAGNSNLNNMGIEQTPESGPERNLDAEKVIDATVENLERLKRSSKRLDKKQIQDIGQMSDKLDKIFNEIWALGD